MGLSEPEKDVLSCWRFLWHNNHVSFASFKYLQSLPHVRSNIVFIQSIRPFPAISISHRKVTLSKLMLRLQVCVEKHHSDWFFICLKSQQEKGLACHAGLQGSYIQRWIWQIHPVQVTKWRNPPQGVSTRQEYHWVKRGQLLMYETLASICSGLLQI